MVYENILMRKCGYTMTNPLLSVKDMARSLRQSEQHVRHLIREGRLNATQVGKQWVAYQDDLDDYILKNDVTIEPHDHERKTSGLPGIVGLSFFSGAMGLDIGMELGGIPALLACEFDKACRTTIEKNKPDIALVGDICDYHPDEILRIARIPHRKKVDVIFGGPPCQAFSTAGKRKGFNDERGNVFLRFIEIVAHIKPTYVVIENVRGLLSAPYPYFHQQDPIKGGALMVVLDGLRSAGYTVSFNLYNAANFGTPQIRERVVIIGKLNGKKVGYLRPTHSENGKFGLPPWRTLGDALKGLDTDKMHGVSFPGERLVYYRMLKEGQYWKDLPKEMQMQALGNSYFLGGGKTGFLRRLSFKKPSPTLVTHPAMPATDLAHPVEDRPLTVEEYKRIQEFPSDWEICGSLLDQYRQIGNAVPIRLGKAIAEAIIKDMANEPPSAITGFQHSRYKNTDEISWEADFKKRAFALQKRQVTMLI